ncbi:MAG: beta-lactamase family protein [Hyphomonadaceae bacterium]|nr:beta-lactamase family protein [Hyphomonadaceae bacterium]
MIHRFSARDASRNSIIVVALATVLSACASVAPETEPVVVETPPIDVAVETVAAAPEPAFSTEGIAALEQAMAAYVADGRLYGIHTRLAHKGEVISDFYTGVRGLESQTPLEEDTIYRIYSMTKPVTGVAMMMLYEEGLFELDDPVTKFVPEFEDLKVLAGVNEDGSAILVDLERAPTMRELMSHTSGFAYGLGGTDPANSAFRDLKVLESPDLQTMIDRTATIPLMFQPGEHWFYSVGMDIQGHIIEKLSGQSFGDFLETRLFTPLGMTDTGFYVPEDDYDRFSEVYGFDPDTGAMVPIPFPGVMFKKETINFESGGGGLVSTMDDYARFAQMLVNQGELDGVRILKPETLGLITTDVLPEGAVLSEAGMNMGELYPGFGMGLTVGTVEVPEDVPSQIPAGSFFWSGAASTWFWIDPVNELYFIGMVQVFDNNNPNGPLELRETSSTAVYNALSAD